MTRTMMKLMFYFIIITVGFENAGYVTACSIKGEYIPPTNYELVQEASSIVLAKVEGFSERDSRSFLNIKVEEILKGEPNDKIIIRGHEIFDGDSKKYDFNHYRSAQGACIPFGYRRGYDYLLFLRKDSDVLFSPFSRVNEEVGGPDDPWVKIVREYIKIGRHDDYDVRMKLLESLMVRLLRGDGDGEYVTAAVNDINDAMFYAPNIATDRLIGKFRQAHTIANRRRVLYSLAKHPEAAELFRKVIVRDKDKKLLGPCVKYTENYKIHELLPNLIEMAIDSDDVSGIIGLQYLLSQNAEKVSADDLLKFWRNIYYPSLEYNEIVGKILKEKIGNNYAKYPESSVELAATDDTDVSKWAYDQIKNNKAGDHNGLAALIVSQSDAEPAEAAVRMMICQRNTEGLLKLLNGYSVSRTSSFQSTDHIIEISKTDNLPKIIKASLIRTLKERIKRPIYQEDVRESIQLEKLLLRYIVEDADIRFIHDFDRYKTNCDDR